MTGHDFILTVREKPRGGSRRTTILEDIRPLGDQIWVIYIHGFNVDQERALRQGRTLWTNLFGGSPPSRVQKGAFLWPSDRYLNRSWSKMAYPAMIDRAARSGRQLGDYLAARNRDSAVLVGHSLGALVALTAADRLRGRGIVRGFALLGAAVDVAEMVDDGSFTFVPLARREAVEYSPSDKVLRQVFRLGQKFAGPYSPRIEAVGLNGQPRSRGWKHHDCGFDHHTHWREPGTAAAVEWVLNHAATGRSPSSTTPAEHNPATRDAEGP
ncbi:hypothetical protein [Amycolatopsis sp. NPDC021455]|uniref:hypothetical protein n=1 Tax=Amycolatopsis sp. NPDC021455 TaxID=3154901 RepID=UPI0033D579CC